MIALPGYEILEKTHEGAKTVLYHAVRLQDHRPVLLKILKGEYPPLHDLALLRHEFEITRDLNLDGAVMPLSLEKYGHSLALILEDFGRGVLKEAVPRPGFRLADFFQIAIQLAEALGGIHQHNIVHKNINSFSILFDPGSTRVKISGFEIAARLAGERLSDSHYGVFDEVLAYCSPEQTGRMNRTIDHRSDFYSLGVVFYELLSGQLPIQSTDPVELVHAHIARQPISPHELKPDLPKAVSEIVMKCLAKMAEDRYQSAHGLKADLAACLEQWQSSGKIEAFTPGRQDASNRFQVSQKLYGRKREIQALLAAHERASRGNAELMLVSGYSGIGKTTLVNEVQKPILQQRGYFISGKFDQLQRNVPYSALIHAFQGLVRQLLTESEGQLLRWKKELLLALRPNGQVIVEVIPGIELITGPQPAVPELPPTEAQNRFRLVFERLIQVFARQDHPLVIFLDDLQWVDSTTLMLLQDLVSDPKIPYLFVIGAYRDNEVGATHSLMLVVDKMRKAGAKISQINLQPLAIDELNQLLADTLMCDPQKSYLLAELVLHKTGGNPFFVTQLLQSLYQEGLFRFRHDSGEWQWNLSHIQAVGITDNVVELMVRKMQRLAEPAQACLQMAASIGSHFDIHTLAIIREKSPAEIIEDLLPVSQAGLILTNSSWTLESMRLGLSAAGREVEVPNPIYRFLHDKVQQAAYSLIAPDQKCAMHLKIGRLLLGESRLEEREEKIFDIANHLNMGAELITRPEERTELAWLNLMAGRKARSAAAFEAALKYLTAGIQLLAKDSWQKQYELTLGLYVDATEAAYMSTDFTRSASYARVVLAHATTLLDKVKIYELQMQSYISQNQMVMAVEIGLEVLDMLGVRLSPDLTDQDLALPKLEELEGLPTMTSPEQLAAMRILVALAPPAFQTRPEIFPQVIRTQIQYCMQHGLSALAAVSYGLYGFLLLAGPNEDIPAGYHAGLVSMKLLELFNAKELKSKVLFIFNGHIRHWQEHARTTIQPFLQGIQSGLETGDLQFVGYNAKDLCTHMFFMGKPLEEVVEQQANYAALLKSIRQEHSTYYIRIWQQAVLNLQDRGNQREQLAGDVFDAGAMLPEFLGANNRNLLFITYTAQAMLHYLFGNHAKAVESSQLAAEHADASAGLMNVGQHVFYESLAQLAAYPMATPERQKQYLAKVRQNLERMRAWTPHNYRHACELVEAEAARILGQPGVAMQAYDQAIASAIENEFTHVEALSNELAANFYLSLGREKIARMYLREAYYAYIRWGASAKAKDLHEKHPALLTGLQEAGSPADRPAVLDLQGSSVQAAVSSTALDLAAVVRSSQAISGEIVLDRLLSGLMEILIENAGAQRAFLVLEKDGDLLIQASGAVDGEINILQAIPLDSSRQLSAAIVNYVRRTGENLVFADVEQDQRFRGDAYIVQNKPKSLLCFPIANQGKAIGILYLENNLTTGAFTPERIETLQILAAQAAISLENARLYAEVQREASERRRAEETLRTITEGTAAVTGGDFFRSLLRHLATAFRVHKAFVTECPLHDRRRVRTLAFLENNQFLDVFEYELSGTPCEGVIDGSVCYYPSDLEHLFPKEEGMQSYLGAPLTGASGEILGHLAIMDDRPMDLSPHARAIFEIFSARAGVELERKRSEEALRNNEQQLRQLNEQLEDYSRNLEWKVGERTREIEQRRQIAESLRDILAILNSNRPLDEILNYIVTEAGRLLASDTSAIYRLNGQEKRFQLQSMQGLSANPISRVEFPPELGEAIRGGQPAAVSELRKASAGDGANGASLDHLAEHCRALLAVPLFITEEIYGCLALFYAGERQFSQEEIALAVAFSDQVALAIENARLRQRARQAAIMEERARLARELHDSVTQSLYSLTLLAEGWRRMARTGKMENTAAQLFELGEIAQQALKEMRLLVYELRPPALEQEGLLGALHQRLNAVEKRAGVDARLLAEEIIDLPAPMEEGLFRIAQEALNNALKHAAATTVSVRLSIPDGNIVLEIQDNGHGFEMGKESAPGGIGLQSMRERAERLGGALELHSAPGKGTTVRVCIKQKEMTYE